MIRPARLPDFPTMVNMGRAFHAQSNTSQFTPWDDATFATTLFQLAATGGLFVYDKDGVVEGMAAAVLMPSYFNRHYVSCNELFCWVNPSARGAGMQLFDMLESWGKEKGAHTMVIASVPNMREEVLDRKYKAKGFTRTDNFYTKVL